MKIRALFTMAVACLTTAGMLFGLTGGTASAASPTQLCIDQSGVGAWCIHDGRSMGAPWGANMVKGGTPPLWSYPTTAYQNTYFPTSANSGYIGEGTTECLQIDEADSWVVRMALCNGSESEIWENWYNPTTGRTEFVSEYYFSGVNNLCLSFDASGTDVPGGLQDILRADPCLPGGAPSGGTSHWYQQWGTS